MSLNNVTRPLNVADDIASIHARARAIMPERRWAALGGTDNEWTMLRNVAALRAIELQAPESSAEGDVDLRTQILGVPLDMPILAGPAPFDVYPQCAADVYRATSDWGTAMIAQSSIPASVLTSAARGVRFRQLYFMGHDATMKAIDDSVASGERGIFLTIDVPGSPLHSRFAHILINDREVSWSERVVCHLRPYLHTDDIAELDPSSVHPEPWRHPELKWSDVEKIRSYTPVPLALKGIQTAEDARIALDHGVDAIVVSNHGGRAQDHVAAAIEALPEVVKAVDGRANVLLGGGIRHGDDVLRALALGADAVIVVRPLFWAMWVLRGEGPAHVFALLRHQFAAAMTTRGRRSLREITPDLVKRAHA